MEWLQRLAGQERRMGWASLIGITAALYMAFVYAPQEKTLGVVQRIFYFHVGSAWNAFLAFLVVAVCSGLYLATRRPHWDKLASASAEVGVLFTTITLLTGSIWGRPVWNTWWTWDPKLTTTLILWFLYVGYLLIRSSAEGNERQARFAAVFGVLGFVDVPIVHISAQLWRSIHPVIVPKMAMEPEMRSAMMVAFLAFTALYAYLVTKQLSVALLADRVAQLKERVGFSPEAATSSIPPVGRFEGRGVN